MRPLSQYDYHIPHQTAFLVDDICSVGQNVPAFMKPQILLQYSKRQAKKKPISVQLISAHTAKLFTFQMYFTVHVISHLKLQFSTNFFSLYASQIKACRTYKPEQCSGNVISSRFINALNTKF
jgi:hypothetical protein